MSGAWHLHVVRHDAMDLEVLVVDLLPVGRAGRGLLLDDDRVSRQHCEFRVDGSRLVVRDCGSSNGTSVDGVALDVERELAAGDVVTIGRTRIEVCGRIELGTTDAATSLRSTTIDATGRPTEQEPGTDEVRVVPQLSTSANGDAQLRASIVGSTLTLVFSDIVESTRLVTELGDRSWMAQLSRHDTISRQVLQRYNGTEVKGQGDGFLLTFPSARHALLFAIELQRELDRTRTTDPTFPVHVRIGVHTGEVLHASGDVFGRHVHRAARIAAHAGADQILASSLVRELAESMGDIEFGPAEARELKGFEGEHHVHRVDWRS